VLTRKTTTLRVSIARFLLACWFVNLVPPGISNALASDCGLKLLGSTDLSVTDGGRARVQVTINEHPATMFLDTANVVSIIKSSQLEPLALRSRTAYRNFIINDTTMTQFAKPNSFALGSLKVEAATFYVLPNDAAPSAMSGPELGWLGMDQLWGSDFELDFANRRLNFYSTKHCSGGAVYWTAKYASAQLTRTPLGTLIFPVQVNGKYVEATLSFTNGRTAMRADAARRLYGFDEASRTMTLSGIGLSNENVRVELVSEPAMPASCVLTSRKTGAYYYLGEECRGIEPPLYLGMDLVRHLHLYFATREQVVYFSDAEAR
jgi:hypothetical protein